MVRHKRVEMKLVTLALLVLVQTTIGPLSARERCSKKILAALHDFISNPINNYEKLKSIEDLDYWLRRYELSYEATTGNRANILESLFRTSFQIDNINEKQIDIIFYLLLNRASYHDDYKYIEKKIIEIACSKPNWFFRLLWFHPERRRILKKIETITQLQSCLDQLGDEQLKGFFLNDISQNEKEKEMELEYFIQFMSDPLGNFDKIKDIDNLCLQIQAYENQIVKNGILERFATNALFTEHFQDINEKKIQILLHLLLNCRIGVHGELICEYTAKIFRDYPKPFIRALQRETKWRSIIAELIELEYDKTEEAIKALGDSRFELKIKRLLDEEERLYKSLREQRRRGTDMSDGNKR
jgi:hypothetical protein